MVSEIPLDTGNTVDVRKRLDEKVMDIMREKGYAETTFWSNIKLLIMATACGVALFAQFNPWEFPDNRLVLGACCFIYAAMSGLLQLVVSVVDKDFIMFCQTKKDSKAQQKAKTVTGVGVRSDLETYDHNYKLIIETLHAKDESSKQKTPLVRVELAADKTSIGNYFDKNGYFYEEIFEEEVTKLIAQFEAKFEKPGKKQAAETKKAK